MTSETVFSPISEDCYELDMIHASGKIILSATRIYLVHRYDKGLEFVMQDMGDLYYQPTRLGMMRNKLRYELTEELFNYEQTSILFEILFTYLRITLTVTDVLHEGSQITAAFSEEIPCSSQYDDCNKGR